MRVLVCFALCAACKSSAIPTKVGFRVETKYPQATLAPCNFVEELLPVLEYGTPITVDELAKAKLIDRAATQARLQKEGPIACLIEQPSPCSVAPHSCTAHVPACARKRGCAFDHQLWVAKMWPPVCAPAWPDEPHCVSDRSKQSCAGWQKDVLHEVAELLLRWNNTSDVGHASAAQAAQQAAWTRYQAARQPAP